MGWLALLFGVLATPLAGCGGGDSGADFSGAAGAAGAGGGSGGSGGATLDGALPDAPADSAPSVACKTDADCPASGTCCGGTCADLKTDPSHCGSCATSCPAGAHVQATCVNGTCGTSGCSDGFADCDGKPANGCEADLSSDPSHCGTCIKACAPINVVTPTCAAGVCGGACKSGYADCNGDKQTDGCEIYLGDDVANCGGCGKACSSNHVTSAACTGGTCSGTCASGFADCDGDKLTNGCEADLSSDAAHCGGCGIACSGNHIGTPSCSGGTCGGTCAVGFADCDGDKKTNGCETDVSSSVSSCGGCGVACSSNHVTPSCAAGTCNGACEAGFTDCDGDKQTNGCERHLADDAQSCGACGVACSSNHVTPSCASGTCSGACAPGFADCDGNKQTNGCEASTQSDPDNCGGCGIKCSGSGMSQRTCTNGVCGGTCASGFANCDGDTKTNGCETAIGTDPSNCGACGKACSTSHMASVTCGGGVCNGGCASGFADCDGNKQTNGCEIDVSSSAANCGGCGKSCSTNHVNGVACVTGTCGGTCAAGFADCDGNLQTNGCEVSIGTDANNCGACGSVCSSVHVASRTCASGACNGTCASGFADCNGNKLSDGCETSTSADPNNCGACGATCSSNHVASVACSGGACSGACSIGFADCNGNKQADGCETSTSADPNNCGACGRACSTNNVTAVSCGGGACNGACAAGYADCDANKQTNGCESNPATDPNNCGACGISCSSNHMQTRTCTGATCDGTCAAGFADCDGNRLSNGCETNTKSDAQNCGNCGNACPNGQVCSNGTCATCNTTVLVLDATGSDATALQSALTAAGLSATMGPTISSYTGVPPAVGFGAILIDVGGAYNVEMPTAGQTAIATAVTQGAGILFTDWASYTYANYSTYLTQLRPYILKSYSSSWSGSSTSVATWTLTSAGHPIWTGLTTSFTSSVSMAGSTGTIINGGTSIATVSTTSSGATPGVIVKDPASGGRSVFIAHAGDSYPSWTTDANLVKMFTNAARWAAKCQ